VTSSTELRTPQPDRTKLLRLSSDSLRAVFFFEEIAERRGRIVVNAEERRKAGTRRSQREQRSGEED